MSNLRKIAIYFISVFRDCWLAHYSPLRHLDRPKQRKNRFSSLSLSRCENSFFESFYMQNSCHAFYPLDWIICTVCSADILQIIWNAQIWRYQAELFITMFLFLSMNSFHDISDRKKYHKGLRTAHKEMKILTTFEQKAPNTNLKLWF